MTHVYPIFVTLPFSGDKAVDNRKKFLEQLFNHLLDEIEADGELFHGKLQFHPFETVKPIRPSELYELLDREAELFPNYIENQRNVNGYLQITTPPRDMTRMKSKPPPARYENKEKDEQFGELEWDWLDRIAVIADDAKTHTLTKEWSQDKDEEFMTVVMVQINMYDLTKEKDDDDDHCPRETHKCAAKIFGKSPEWCRERSIEAMRLNATHVSIVLANLECGNLFFHEMAEWEKDGLRGTDHDDSIPWPNPCPLPHPHPDPLPDPLPWEIASTKKEEPDS